MPEAICEQELARDMQMLLRRLDKASGYLLRTGGPDGWSVFSAKNGYRRPVGRVPDGLVQAMAARDLVAPRPGGGFVPASQARRVTSEATLDGEPVRRNETEWALGWLRGRHDAQGLPLICDAQFAAAEILRRDYTSAALEPRVTQNWDSPAEVSTPGSRGAGHLTPSDRALAARQRLRAALDAVGPELSGILLEICCLSAGMEQAERALGLPQRAGKPILQLALTRLARHYGLIEKARPQHPAIGHWGRDDYRPRLGPGS